MKKPKIRFPKPAVEFEVPVYGGDVYLFLDEEAFNQAMTFCCRVEEPQDVAGGRCAQLISKEGRALYLVGWFTSRYSTLVHECGHLALFVLRRAEIDPTESNGEVYCYLLGALVALLTKEDKPKK